MIRIHRTAIALLACGLALASEAAAQVPATGIADQLRLQWLTEHLVESQLEGLDALRARTRPADERASAAAQRQRAEHLETLFQQNRSRSRTLTVLGAAALAGGVASYAANSERGLTGAQSGLVAAGFGLTMMGGRRWQVATLARAEAEQHRERERLASGP